MTLVAAKHFWTDEELLALPKDGCDREVIDGTLVVSPANIFHGRSIGRLLSALGAYVYERQLGEVLDGQTGVRMKDGSLLSPDISFVSTETWKACEASGETFLIMSPELVVEVLSESDTADRMDQKLELYFGNGTKLAWVIHPRSKSVHIHRERVADRILRVDGVLNGDDVIPGFVFEISRLF